MDARIQIEQTHALFLHRAEPQKHTILRVGTIGNIAIYMAPLSFQATVCILACASHEERLTALMGEMGERRFFQDFRAGVSSSSYRLNSVQTES